MLRSPNLEVLLITPSATDAEKDQITSAFRNFGWALFRTMNASHLYVVSYTHKSHRVMCNMLDIGEDFQARRNIRTRVNTFMTS